MVDQNQRITPPRFNLGTGAGTSGDTGLGHGVGFTDRWLGLGSNGQGGWESDLQGLTWGHGTGTRVRLLGTTG